MRGTQNRQDIDLLENYGYLETFQHTKTLNFYHQHEFSRQRNSLFNCFYHFKQHCSFPLGLIWTNSFVIQCCYCVVCFCRKSGVRLCWFEDATGRRCALWHSQAAAHTNTAPPSKLDFLSWDGNQSLSDCTGSVSSLPTTNQQHQPQPTAIWGGANDCCCEPGNTKLLQLCCVEV